MGLADWRESCGTRGVAAWDVGRPAPTAARLAAMVSIVLWLMIVTAGRMIAYIK